MGIWSSEEVETTGQITTNIALEETIDGNSNELTTLVGIICIIKVLELIVFVYKTWIKTIRKKYEGRAQP